MLFPTDAWAWTPGTHVFLGDALLRNLSFVPHTIAELLAAYPTDFLYGSIAADTSIAKKYAEVGRHCHSWRVGLEIHNEAEPPALRAFGLGYLAHLAADVVAHKRGVKLIAFKMKRRKGYHRTVGHRQELTVVKIKEIKA